MLMGVRNGAPDSIRLDDLQFFQVGGSDVIAFPTKLDSQSGDYRQLFAIAQHPADGPPHSSTASRSAGLDMIGGSVHLLDGCLCLRQTALSRAGTCCSSSSWLRLMIPQEVNLIPLYILFKQIHMDRYTLAADHPADPAESLRHLPVAPVLSAPSPTSWKTRRGLMGRTPGQSIPGSSCRSPYPALVTLGIFIFLYNWNQFLTPLIYLNSTEQFHRTAAPLFLSLRLRLAMGSTDGRMHAWPWLPLIVVYAQSASGTSSRASR